LARIEKLRSEVARRGEQRLSEQEGQRQQTIEREKTIEQQLNALESQRQALQAEQAETVKQGSRGKSGVQAGQMSLSEMGKRSEAMMKELGRLHKLPRATKKLRYQTPISAPLQTEELMFECFHGRVTLLDSGALIADIQRQMRSKSELLRNQWEVRDV